MPRLRRLALVLTGDLDQADDLVQETCMRALARVARWQTGTAGFYGIAQNIWRDRMRAHKVRGEGVGLEAAEAISGGDGRNVVESWVDLAAMAELPEDQRVLVALVCIDGLSYKEAAEITGTPIDTVKSHLARARRELYARMHAPQAAAARRAPKLGVAK
jgi:RNA polymerase sigma-70 factor (ECF subfamily)